MNWKTWLPLILSIALGLVAAKAGRDMILRSQRLSKPDGKTTKIVVAKADLEPGHPLTEEDLQLAVFPTDTLPKPNFTQVSDLVGRVVVLPVVKGQAVVEQALAPAGSEGGAQALVPPGMRAITVEINEVSGVGGLLTPGCRVDVVSTLLDQSSGKSNQMARTIVENVRVMAIGQRLGLGMKKDVRADEQAVKEAAAVAKSVTLLVRPRDAEVIQLAMQAGGGRLLLRNTLDDQIVQNTGITIAELIGKKEPEQPVEVQMPIVPVKAIPIEQPATRPARRVRVVEFITGGEVQRVEYDLPGAPGASEVTHADPGEVISGSKSRD